MIYISDSLVLSTPSEVMLPFTHSRIGYRSIGQGRNPVASSSTPGFPASNANNYTTFEFWRPAAMPATWRIDAGGAEECDYIGVVGDVIGRGVAVEYSFDNASWFVALEFLPTRQVSMGLFQPRTARYWRARFTGSVPTVAVIFIGKALAMQRPIYVGHSPLSLSRTTEVTTNTSEKGQYLGRSIVRTGVKSSAEFKNLKSSWYRSHFDPFVIAARVQPFFFAWRPASFPNEVGYVWTDDDIAPENSGPRDFMSVSFSFTGIGVD
jgi:hypothetical protein